MSRLIHGLALWVFFNTMAQIGYCQKRTILSKQNLVTIDRLAADLTVAAEELHDEFHLHLERVKHAEKLEQDVSAVERIAASLHDFAHVADGSEKSMLKMRRETNELLQLSSQIRDTVERARTWVRTRNGRLGIGHMRSAASDVVQIALAIDDYLPVDTRVIDAQADRLERSVKELHAEFHEHLEGYQMSRHLDQDLEDLEKSVEHIHDLAHNKRWAEINFRHVLEDLSDVEGSVGHIEGLLDQQSRQGVRTRDFIGIEHSRDAVTDVLSSIYLLRHMIFKADPRLDHRHHLNRSNGHHPRVHHTYRPLRDQHLDEYRYRVRDEFHP